MQLRWVIAAIIIAGSAFGTGIAAYSLLFPPPAKIRVGYLIGDLHHLPFFVALDQGYYDELGLDVEVVPPFKAGPELMMAMGKDYLDFGYVGTPPAIIASIRGIVPKGIMVIAAVNREGSCILSSPGIRSGFELAGKRIATPLPGSIQYVMLGMYLAQHNLSYADLAGAKPIILAPPDMVTAFAKGELDGYFAWEPYCAAGLLKNGTILVESGQIWPDHPCCVLVVRKDYAQEHPELVEKMVRAHLKAIRFIQQNPDQAKLSAVKWTGLGKEVIDEAMKRMIFKPRLEPEFIQGAIRFVHELIKLKVLKPEEVPDPEGFIAALIQPKYLELAERRI